MRAIKFRAWDIVDKKFVFFELRKEVNNHTPPISIWAQLQGWEQFTGLLDKNGKEIYEGDIFDGNEIVAWYDELSWDSGGSCHPGFYLKSEHIDESGDLDYSTRLDNTREIIGNIHENHNLLEAL